MFGVNETPSHCTKKNGCTQSEQDEDRHHVPDDGILHVVIALKVDEWSDISCIHPFSLLSTHHLLISQPMMLTFEFSLPLRIPFSHPKTVRNPYFIVKSWEKAGYWAEFWHETLKKSDGRWKAGKRMHHKRAMRSGWRFDSRQRPFAILVVSDPCCFLKI
jgi:hypothetical protein